MALLLGQRRLAMQLPLFQPPTVSDPPPRRRRPPIHYLPIYKITLVREAAMSTPRPQIRSSADAADLLRRYLGDIDREAFVVILVDRKNRLIGINMVSVGSLTASVVHPREV
jgi:RadC-like JAB domain